MLSEVLPDIIDNFLQSLVLKSRVLATYYSAENNQTSLEFENIYCTREKQIVKDGQANEYAVIEVNNKTNLLNFEGNLQNLFGEIIYFPMPKFLHGTPIETNNSLNSLEDIQEYQPLIYLYQTTKETFKSIDSSLERESQIVLYFLDNANFEDWTTAEYYKKRILGLHKLAIFFIEKAKQYKRFYLDETDFVLLDEIKFGNFVTMKGTTKNIFDQFLTGKRLEFVLPIRKSC